MVDILGPRTLGLGVVARPADVADVHESGSTLEANARLKARAVRDATGEAAIADDTGLEVEALDGAPGIRTARFAGPTATDADNVALLLERLDAVPLERRRARFVTVAVASFPHGRELAPTVTADATIASAARGTGAFDCPPVVIPPRSDRRSVVIPA